MRYVIVITGASSGFGLLTAYALAGAGHRIYASMRDMYWAQCATGFSATGLLGKEQRRSSSSGTGRDIPGFSKRCDL